MGGRIVPLFMGEFTFPADEAWAGERGIVVAYAIRHRAGIVLFDTGFGFGDRALDERYRVRARRLPEVLGAAGIDRATVAAVVNCHLHADHAGQNVVLPGVPTYVQPAEWELAQVTDHTNLDRVDFPGADVRLVAGDHDLADGVRVIATPGHTAGHQSVVVSDDDGETVLVGQAVYSVGEWIGDPAGREGRSQARDPIAYDASITRLRALRPAQVLFAHDETAWSAD